MEEIWRPVVGYEGLYEVSNLGRVRSTVILGEGIGRGKFRKGIILSPDINKSRYNYIRHRFNLSKNGKPNKLMAHVLVAKAFPEICGKWFEGCEVHHIDFNSLNNCANNLLVVSKQEHTSIHIKAGKFNGERNPFYGKHHKTKIKTRIARKNRKPIVQETLDGVQILCWMSCTDCERETGMKKSSINRCCIGKQNTAYGYVWKYAKEEDN